MWLYDTLMVWLLPLCVPLAMASVAAFVCKSRIVLFVPIVVAALCMSIFPPPRIYASFAPGTSGWHIHRVHTRWESEHMLSVALWSGLLATVIVLVVLKLANRRFFKRKLTSTE